MSRANKDLASNEEWKAWGELDPLYGVATIPGRAKNGADPWTNESFYDTGGIDWSTFQSAWEQYGVKPGTCVEIGCGAGRLTAPLAKFFQAVHGLDVSAGMIEYARRRVPPNVSLHLTDGQRIPLANGSVDAAFSTHVLQHLPDADATVSYLREVSRVLKPGGTIMVHVPLIVWPHRSLQSVHRLVHRANRLLDAWSVELQRLAFAMRISRKPPMRVISYETSWLHAKLVEANFRNVEIRILFGASAMGLQHPFVFATKGGGHAG